MPRHIEDWNREYTEGAHWEKAPSSQVREFIKTLKPGQRVLDAGCGSGRDSLFMADSGFDVTGVDVSEVAIQKAKQKNAEQELNAKFAVADLEKLSFQDESFDAVYSGYTLQETDLQQSIAELARVLKRGGTARLVLFQETEYENSGNLDKKIDPLQIIDILKKHFDIVSQTTDEYEESDQFGKHRHKRLAVVLQKRDHAKA